MRYWREQPIDVTHIKGEMDRSYITGSRRVRSPVIGRCVLKQFNPVPGALNHGKAHRSTRNTDELV